MKEEHVRLKSIEQTEKIESFTYSDAPQYNQVYSSTANIPRDSWTNDFVTLTSVKGNRKSPSPHSFIHTTSAFLTGSRVRNEIVQTFEPGFGTATTKRYFTASGPNGDACPGNDFMASNTAYNNALGKLYEQLRGSVDLSIDAAEAKKTFGKGGMIHTAAKMETYVRGFSRKTLANRWLEFAYGWRPLANTLYEGIQQSYSRANALLLITARASDQEYRKVVSEQPGWTVSTEFSQRCRVHMFLKYRPSNSTLDLISRFTSLNPVSIAWELVPYSFVVDWVYDVGGYLRNLETSMTVVGSITDSYQTIGWLNKTSQLKMSNGSTDVNGVKWESGSYSGTTQQTMKVRSILSAAPIPAPPRFNVNMGSSRLLSAASLLAQWLPEGPRKQVQKKRILEKNFSNFVNKTWRERNRKK